MRVLIAGGGTGGHLFPGLAVAEEVTRRDERSVVGFVGTAQGIEARILPSEGHDLQLIDVIRLKGGGLLGWAKGLLMLPRAFWQSLSVLRRFRPDVVVGVGGYASGPVLLVAALTGRRTAVMEQNAVPGFTNRVLGRFVDRVLLTFEQAGDSFPKRKVRLPGNPVRRSIRDSLLAGAGATPAPAPRDGPLRILIFGGSQGARALNQALPGALGALDRPFEVRHQTGEAGLAQVRQAYAELGIEADTSSFIHGMAEAYRWCDIAVCRAGATTICELAVAGVPSILVPFPLAADDHQTANARALVEAGAAESLQQADLGPESLAALLRPFADDRGRLQAMAEAARAVGRPDAAGAVVDELEALANGPR